MKVLIIHFPFSTRVTFHFIVCRLPLSIIFIINLVYRLSFFFFFFGLICIFSLCFCCNFLFFSFPSSPSFLRVILCFLSFVCYVAVVSLLAGVVCVSRWVLSRFGQHSHLHSTVSKDTAGCPGDGCACQRGSQRQRHHVPSDPYPASTASSSTTFPSATASTFHFLWL